MLTDYFDDKQKSSVKIQKWKDQFLRTINASIVIHDGNEALI